MSGPRVHDYTRYRGMETVVLENRSVRVVVLAGKGADVVEFRNKDADANLLFEAPHNWQPLGGAYHQSLDNGTAWMDHYPGGWQACLPIAGNDPGAAGAEYGIHGEASLIPWEYEIVEDTADAVAVTFSCELVRYPFKIERTLCLEADDATLSVTTEVKNLGTIDLPYVWLEHVAFGTPLLGEGARIDLPSATVTVEEEPQGESPLPWGQSFEWPGEGDADMSTLPAPDAGIHDLSYLRDLAAGWYAVTNPEADIGAAVSFDATHFESIWCWRALGGFEASPFFGRERVLGLEPCTGWPATDPVEAQGPDGTGTLEHLAAGETIETSMDVTTYRGRDGVDSYDEVA